MILAILILAMLLPIAVGECIGHDKVRYFLFWVRGRSPETGKPTRRWYLP